MGTYYGVRKIVENGEKIGFAPEKQPRIGEDNILVGILSNGVWAIAPDLTRESEYQQFYALYLQGMWLKMEIYKIPKDKIKDCPNEGRVSVRELEQILKANSLN
ncbi:MAG: hypothetical protein Q8R53_03805 [Nanoarchaeota archaeon]|nr:hypothetical protein [Nanoarchaeota archaeon]